MSKIDSPIAIIFRIGYYVFLFFSDRIGGPVRNVLPNPAVFQRKISARRAKKQIYLNFSELSPNFEVEDLNISAFFGITFYRIQ